MRRLLISGILLFTFYLFRLIAVLGGLSSEAVLMILAVVKWGLWIWFLVELIIYVTKNRGKGNSGKRTVGKKTIHLRWLISIIVTVVGTFFAFAIFIGDKPGMSESSVLILVWTTFVIYTGLIVWVLVESIIFSRKNRNALPLSSITAFFSVNVLFVLFIQILYNSLNLAVPSFVQNGRGYFFLFSSLIFLGLAVWAVIKGIILIKNKEDVNLGIVSLIVGGITILVALWFIQGAIYIFSFTPEVVTPVTKAVRT